LDDRRRVYPYRLLRGHGAPLVGRGLRREHPAGDPGPEALALRVVLVLAGDDGCTYYWDGYKYTGRLCRRTDGGIDAYTAGDGVWVYLFSVGTLADGTVWGYWDGAYHYTGTLADGTTWAYYDGAYHYNTQTSAASMPGLRTGWDGVDRSPNADLNLAIVNAQIVNNMMGALHTNPNCAMMLPTNFDGDDGDGYADLSDIAEECS